MTVCSGSNINNNVTKCIDEALHFKHHSTSLSHQSPHPKLDRAFGWNLDLFQSLGILCCSGLTYPWFKHTKVAELKAVALGKFSNDFIQELLDHGLNGHTLGLSFPCDSVDEFLFSYVWH